MTAQQHDRPRPEIERSFSAVRAALPAENAAAFDAEFARITNGPVADFAAVDEFLAGWHRIAVRIASDPEDWQRVLQIGRELESGIRKTGVALADVLASRLKVEPAEPEFGHGMIRVGSYEGAVVPMGDYLRLRAIERHASAEEIEEAEIEAATEAHERWVAAGRPGARSHDEVMGELLAPSGGRNPASRAGD